MPARKPRKKGHGIEFRVTVHTPLGPKRLSKTFHKRKAGEKWVREQIERSECGEVGLPVETTLAEAFSRYLEQRGPALAPASRRLYASFWSSHLSPEFGATLLAAIRTTDLQAWTSRLLTEGMSPGSVVRVVNLLRAVLNLAIEARELRSNPCRGLKLPAIRKVRETRMYTDGELAVVLEACSTPRLLALVRVALGTGMRRGELLAMTWNWIDDARQVIRIPASIEAGFVPKGRRFREVNVGPDVKAALKAWKRKSGGQPDDRVFPGENINRWARVIRKNTGVIRANARGFELDKLEPDERRKIIARLAVPFRWHLLRHTAISRMVQAGVKLRHVMELSGHTSLRMLQVYSHLEPDGALAEVRAKLPRGIGGERVATKRRKPHQKRIVGRKTGELTRKRSQVQIL